MRYASLNGFNQFTVPILIAQKIRHFPESKGCVKITDCVKVRLDYITRWTRWPRWSPSPLRRVFRRPEWRMDGSPPRVFSSPRSIREGPECQYIFSAYKYVVHTIQHTTLVRISTIFTRDKSYRYMTYAQIAYVFITWKL